jgi:mannose-6-phosphate isomerase-like protein (cupin superfamily)
MNKIDKVNMAEALSRISDHWRPRIAGEVNDALVKLVKFEGEFDWHHHEVEDEMFLVISGTMRMGLRDGDVDVGPGEFIIVPHGVEHRPEALGGECHVMLIEPKGTVNTGNVVTEKTHIDLERIG